MFQNRGIGGIIVVTLATIVIVTFWAKITVNLVGADTIKQAAQALVNIINGASTSGGL
jgi:hypothetical protein